MCDIGSAYLRIEPRSARSTALPGPFWPFIICRSSTWFSRNPAAIHVLATASRGHGRPAMLSCRSLFGVHANALFKLTTTDVATDSALLRRADASRTPGRTALQFRNPARPYHTLAIHLPARTHHHTMPSPDTHDHTLPHRTTAPLRPTPSGATDMNSLPPPNSAPYSTIPSHLSHSMWCGVLRALLLYSFVGGFYYNRIHTGRP